MKKKKRKKRKNIEIIVKNNKIKEITKMNEKRKERSKNFNERNNKDKKAKEKRKSKIKEKIEDVNMERGIRWMGLVKTRTECLRKTLTVDCILEVHLSTVLERACMCRVHFFVAESAFSCSQISSLPSISRLSEFN